MARRTASARPKSRRHQESSRGARQKSQSGTSRRKSTSNTTTDHDEIRRWAESLGGNPACVKGTGGSEDIGMLRIEFPDAPNANDQKLQPIDWDEFFDKFDERNLALLYQDRTADGQKSHFYKLIGRETAAGAPARHRRRSPSRRSSSHK